MRACICVCACVFVCVNDQADAAVLVVAAAPGEFEAGVQRNTTGAHVGRYYRGSTVNCIHACRAAGITRVGFSLLCFCFVCLFVYFFGQSILVLVCECRWCSQRWFFCATACYL